MHRRGVAVGPVLRRPHLVKSRLGAVVREELLRSREDVRRHRFLNAAICLSSKAHISSIELEVVHEDALCVAQLHWSFIRKLEELLHGRFCTAHQPYLQKKQFSIYPLPFLASQATVLSHLQIFARLPLIRLHNSSLQHMYVIATSNPVSN